MKKIHPCRLAAAAHAATVGLAGVLLVTGSVDRPRAEQALSRMRDILSGLRGGKELAADFVRARRRVLRRVLADTVGSRKLAGELELVVANGLELGFFDDLAASVAQLRLEDVREVISTELSTEREVVVGQGERAVVEEMFRSVGINDVRVIE